MKIVFSVLLAALVLSGPVLAQTEAEEEKSLLAEWDLVTSAMSRAQRVLNNLQIAYNGAEDAQRKLTIEKQFELTRDEALGKATVFIRKVNHFIEQYPRNQAIRKRRLEDTVFDRLSPSLKADDAEVLYELTKNGEYLHKAAEFREKAYDYAAAAKLWEKAAELASTFKVWDALGRCYMNTNEFRRSQAAYERAKDLASSDQQRRGADHSARVATVYVEDWKREQALRKEAMEKKDLPMVEFQTDRGRMLVELFENEAPNTVANFIELAEKGFFDGQLFHRCIAYFMIQGGDPTGTGRGGPGYNIADEYERDGARLHYQGTLSMANVGKPNTGGSQFFVTNVVTPHLNGRHTVFGRVVEGLEVAQVMPLDPTNRAEPFRILSVKVLRKRDHPYVAKKIMP